MKSHFYVRHTQVNFFNDKSYFYMAPFSYTLYLLYYYDCYRYESIQICSQRQKIVSHAMILRKFRFLTRKIKFFLSTYVHKINI